LDPGYEEILKTIKYPMNKFVAYVDDAEKLTFKIAKVSL